MHVYESTPFKKVAFTIFTSGLAKETSAEDVFFPVPFTTHTRQRPSLEPFFFFFLSIPASREEHLGIAFGFQQREFVGTRPLKKQGLGGGLINQQQLECEAQSESEELQPGGPAGMPLLNPQKWAGDRSSFQHLPGPQCGMPSHGGAKGEKRSLLFHLPL